MPRGSSRPTPKSPQAPAPASGASKRRASARLSASHEVKKVKSDSALKDQVKSTDKKSKYFEPESSAESDPEANDSGEDSGSAYEDKDEESSPAPESEPEEPSDSEEDSKSHTKGKQGRSSSGKPAKGKELWREGVRTGLSPGKEVFFSKPKARDPGDVPYEDETLHPNTRLFLLDLAENNDREWFKGKPKPARSAARLPKLTGRSLFVFSARPRLACGKEGL